MVYAGPPTQKSSYVPIGRPDIQHSRPAAPTTPVGTAYESKRDELASIRQTQQQQSAGSRFGGGSTAGRLQTAPESQGIAAVKAMTPPVARSPVSGIL